MGAQATLVIDFGAAGIDAILEAELDSDKNLGKTSFNSGDVVFFRVYSDVPYTIETTSGIVSEEGANPEQEAVDAEILNFVGEKSVDTGKLIRDGSPLIVTWYGTVLGTLTKTGSKQLTVDTALTDILGICKVEYQTEYDVWRLTPPGGMPEEYAILVLIKAT